MERVTPRLQHANCAVVLSAVKVRIAWKRIVQSSDIEHLISFMIWNRYPPQHLQNLIKTMHINSCFSENYLLSLNTHCFYALQVILQQMELITSADLIRNLCKKMAPPLVTLISAEPEIQYVALRNINLIIQKRPNILAHEIKVLHDWETLFLPFGSFYWLFSTRAL